MTFKTLTLTLIFFGLSTLAFSQDTSQKKGLQLTPYAGLSSPLGELGDFAESGFTFGLATDVYLSPTFALGLDINQQSNSYSGPDKSFLESNSSFSRMTSGSWQSTAITFGPTYRIPIKKASLELYSKLGFLYTKTPSDNIFYEDDNFSRTIFSLEEQERTAFAVTSGLRLNLQVSPKLGLFLNPQYVYSSTEAQYCNCGLDDAADAQGNVNPDAILDAPAIEETISVSYFNFNAGLAWKLGNKKSSNNLDKDEEAVCNPSILKEPYNGETYFAESGKIPRFEWINHSSPSERSYVFELYQNGKMIYSKETKRNTFKFSKRQTSDFYGIKEAKTYTWRVVTNYNNCISTITDFSTFTIQPKNDSNRARGTCDYNFVNVDIDCDSPAFDSNGNVKYVGTFTVCNDSPYDGILIPHPQAINSNIFDVDVAGAVLTVNNNSFTDCPPVAMANTPFGSAFTPGQQATYCFELTVPIGTTTINFLSQIKTQPGELDESFCPDFENVTLPNCMCDTCDNWQFNDNEHELLKNRIPTLPFNFQAVQDLQIVGAQPIMKVKAEIISVRHVANDPQCYMCTKHESSMGLFSFETLKPRILGSSNWANINATIGKDINRDLYSNQAIWSAQDAAVGVDFNIAKRFVMPISLPKQSSLDCCEYEYEVCIRYTFTDIDCNSCSYEQCYLSDGTTPPIIIGNPSGGTIPNTSNTPFKKL